MRKYLFSFSLIFLACSLFADSTTTRMGLVVPSVGTAGYAPKINNDLVTIDSMTAVLSGTNIFTGANTFISSLLTFIIDGSTYSLSSLGLGFPDGSHQTTAYVGMSTGAALTGGNANGVMYVDSSTNVATSSNFTYNGSTLAVLATGAFGANGGIISAPRMTIGNTNRPWGGDYSITLGGSNRALGYRGIAMGSNAHIGATHDDVFLYNGVDGTFVLNSSYAREFSANATGGFNFMINGDTDAGPVLQLHGVGGGTAEELAVVRHVSVGTTTARSTFTVNGIIESLWGGFVFPDGSTQTTAATGSSSTAFVSTTTSSETIAFSTSNAFENVVSTVITSGEWDLMACVTVQSPDLDCGPSFSCTGADGSWGSDDANNIARAWVAISTYTGNTTTDHVVGYNEVREASPNYVCRKIQTLCPSMRLSVTGNTTVYLKAKANWCDGGSGAGFYRYGTLKARKVQ